RDLHLDRSPEFNAGKPDLIASYISRVRQFLEGILTAALSPKKSNAPPTAGAAEPDSARPYVNAYVGRINVAQTLRTRLVTIGFDAADPVLAAKIANAHAEHLIQQNLQFRMDANQFATDFLRK